MTPEVGLEQLISICKANVSVSLVLEEDRYLTELLRQHLTDSEMMYVTAEEALRDVAYEAITRLVMTRLEDPTSMSDLLYDEDIPWLASTFEAVAKEGHLAVEKNGPLSTLFMNVSLRFMGVFARYCLLIRPSQRTAVTVLTMAAVTLSHANRVGIEDTIHDHALRAQVLRQILPRNAWLEVALEQPLRNGWKDFNDGVKASLRAIFERRAREIWGS